MSAEWKSNAVLPETQFGLMGALEGLGDFDVHEGLSIIHQVTFLFSS